MWGLLAKVLAGALVAAVVFFIVATPSVTVWVSFVNNLDCTTNACVLDFDSQHARYVILEAQGVSKMHLWEGESMAQVRKKSYLVVALTQTGRLVHHQVLEGGDIRRETRVLIQEKDEE
jgi:hypothetical protein